MKRVESLNKIHNLESPYSEINPFNENSYKFTIKPILILYEKNPITLYSGKRNKWTNRLIFKIINEDRKSHLRAVKNMYENMYGW